MKKVISASRRTDLVAFFPEWLASSIKDGQARVYGPSGRTYIADLRPEAVHTVVLWSKNFENLILSRRHLRDYLEKYDQLYFHFTITGLGGTSIEKKVPLPKAAFRQLRLLPEIARSPERISLRFDPVLFWEEAGKVQTNLPFFERLAVEARNLGIKNIRFSFAQWYGKAVRRAAKHGFRFVDPSLEEKKEAALSLADIARNHGLALYSCSQDFLTAIPGIMPSSCIDGQLLRRLHPAAEPVSILKDKTQRQECRCTESIDIGSYTKACPHSCLYCYANPMI